MLSSTADTRQAGRSCLPSAPSSWKTAAHSLPLLPVSSTVLPMNNNSNSSNNNNNSSCNSSCGVIRPMDTSAVQRIVAGQAITDLASAVKELIDNALDAGSKNINIRLFKQGLDIVEVSDDGYGIPKASRPMIALPHATSKLQSFDQIYSSLNTLGFRGEALFCLAQLSGQLVVATRTSQEEFAERLQFHRDGRLDGESRTEIPRKVGTTVAVVQLFRHIPVRRQDLERRIATQRAKLIALVEEYAINSVGVKIHLMDMVNPSKTKKARLRSGNGRRCDDREQGGGELVEKTILSTTSNSKSVQEAVSSVLGSAVLSRLCPICIDITEAIGTTDRSGTKTEGNVGAPRKPTYRVEGLISKASKSPGADGGQASQVHQYISINRRPVDMPNITRMLNEMWRTAMGSALSQHRPSFILQFFLPPQAYDINLSPDKRDVLLASEHEVLDCIVKGIASLWSSQLDGTFSTVTSQNMFRFTRRYAFSHDLANAKMQHEFQDGRQLKSSPESKRSTIVFQGDSILEATEGKTSEGLDMDRAEPDQGLEAAVVTTIDDSKSMHQARSLSFTSHHSFGSTGSTDPQVKRLRRSETVDPITITPSPGHTTNTASMDHNTPEMPLQHPPYSEFANMAELEDCNAFRKDPEGPTTKPALSSPSVAERRNWQSTIKSFQSPSGSGLGEEIQVMQRCELESRTQGINMNKAEAKSVVASEGNIFDLRRFGFAAVDTGEEGGNGGNKASSKNLHCDEHSSRLHPRKMEATTPVAQIDTNTSNSKPMAASQRNEGRQNAGACTDETETTSKDIPQQQAGLSSFDSLLWHSFDGTRHVVAAAHQARIVLRDRKRKFQMSRKELSDPVDSFCGDESDNEDDFNPTDYGNRNVRLTSEDFGNMTIIGQFNLGFILARSRDNHLWIFDQHACDEKYNFEKLCEETVIHEQRLIAPMPLELSPSEEACILDHMETFEKNGFRFQVDETKPPRHRLSLTALPHSGARDGCRAVQFGKDDVSMLCSILGAESFASFSFGGGTGTDGSGMHGNNAVRRYAGSAGMHTTSLTGAAGEKVIARLPKAIAMFASRACRGSIMIGKALSEKEMDRIVKRLSVVKHPWNCPHGRPTLRHVSDLREVLACDERNGIRFQSRAKIVVSELED